MKMKKFLDVWTKVLWYLTAVMVLATIATRPRVWSPLERAIPPHTIPTRPPRGNMASPSPASTRPATDQGRPWDGRLVGTGTPEGSPARPVDAVRSTGSPPATTSPSG